MTLSSLTTSGWVLFATVTAVLTVWLLWLVTP
jgi:hypothetical protein